MGRMHGPARVESDGTGSRIWWVIWEYGLAILYVFLFCVRFLFFLSKRFCLDPFQSDVSKTGTSFSASRLNIPDSET